jgi:hypothetical protein
VNNIQEKDWADENNWGAHSGMSNDSEYSTVEDPGDQTKQNVTGPSTTDQSA